MTPYLGINVPSPQSESTPRRLTLIKGKLVRLIRRAEEYSKFKRRSDDEVWVKEQYELFDTVFYIGLDLNKNQNKKKRKRNGKKKQKPDNLEKINSNSNICFFCKHSFSKIDDLIKHIGPEYLDFFPFISSKGEENILSLPQFVYFLRVVCSFFNF